MRSLRRLDCDGGGPDQFAISFRRRAASRVFASLRVLGWLQRNDPFRERFPGHTKRRCFCGRKSIFENSTRRSERRTGKSVYSEFLIIRLIPPPRRGFRARRGTIYPENSRTNPYIGVRQALDFKGLPREMRKFHEINRTMSDTTDHLTQTRHCIP